MNKKPEMRAGLVNVWQLPLALVSVLIVSLILIYYPTTSSIVNTWNSSETFAHGYIILPISLWLVWRNRFRFHSFSPSVNYASIPFILLVSFAWLLAYLVDVQIVQQLAFVFLIPLLVYGLLGLQTVKAAAFPLFFLLFAVPMGEELVPYLIEFTADFTVAMVQMTGIPIYREGTFFQLPTGSWSVVTACSGVRYLIASVTLGFLYAYLTYKSTKRRVIFIVASIFVPIIANGLRAFMIVMIGHFSDMQLATGVDHLIYGWVFFGIIIVIMFYIGSFWREDVDEGDQEEIEAKQVDKTKRKTEPKQFAIVFLALMLAMSILPVKAYIDNAGNKDLLKNVEIAVPNSAKWEESEELASDWTPRYRNMDATLVANYVQHDAKIDLFVGYYTYQRDGAQLITSVNVLTKESEEWNNIGASSIKLSLASGDVTVPLAHLKKGTEQILVAYFYYLDGKVITNKYRAKLVEAQAKLFSGDLSASVVMLSSRVDDNRDQVVENIQAFASEMDKAIFISIDNSGNAK